MAGTEAWLHPVIPTAAEVFIGPHLRDGDPGCSACFARRRSAAQTEDAARLEALALSCMRRGEDLAPAFAPILPRLAARAHALALRDGEACGDAGGGGAAARNRFQRVLPDGSLAEDGRLLALHGCACRGAPQADGRRTHARLPALLGLRPAQGAA